MKRRGALGLAAALVVMMLGTCAPAGLARLSIPGGVARGVTVVREGAAVEIKSNLALKRGDVVQTDARATAVVHFAEGTATLLPGTKVTVGSIWTWFGRVFFSGRVNSQTQYTSMSVQGTEYFVEVSEGGPTVVTVLAGRVGVSAQSGQFPSTFVEARHQLTFEPRGVFRVEPVPPARLESILRQVRPGPPTPPPDAGGGRTRKSSDPCEQIKDCAACEQRSDCGYCVAQGACLSLRRRNECGSELGAWRAGSKGPSSCADCSHYQTCGDCTSDFFCQWSRSGRCYNSYYAPPDVLPLGKCR